uniref:NADAR domain-containing protein n=1 Tax=viral metagenome TaxID=1070528 RepID=A0A6C0EKF6_9ZZZZ
MSTLPKKKQALNKEVVLRLDNPYDIPFGPLSNNYLHYMRIDGKQWGTVTNYILSNMLITPLFRAVLQIVTIRGSPKKTNIDNKVKAIIANVEAKQRSKLTMAEIDHFREMIVREVAIQKMDIYQMYNHFLYRENFSNVRSAVERAYNAKVADDTALAQVLIDSGNVPILYISGNAQLGTGPDGRGANLIGVTLMQIRHNLRAQEREESREQKNIERDNRIFVIYKAYVILRSEIGNGSDLSEYMGMSAKEIVDTWKELHPDDTLESLNIFGESKEGVVQMYNRGQFKIFDREIKKPGSLVLLMRRGMKNGDKFIGGLRELRSKMENKRADAILELYTVYQINKEFPQLSPEQQQEAALQLQQASPSLEEYFKLRNRVVTLYNQGEFSDQLNDMIKERLDTLHIPSMKEIKDAEELRSSSRSASKEESDKSTDSSDADDNYLKQLLSTDDKAQKKFLIQRIQKYTGKSSDRYRKYSIEELQAALERYEPKAGSDQPAKKPKKKAGHWDVFISHKRPMKGVGRREKIGEFRGSEPNRKKVLDQYNSERGTDISLGQVFVKWVPAHVSEEEEEEEEEDEIGVDYVKPAGKPIEIRALVDQNPADWREFSPLFQKMFDVGEATYPSVSIYITTMLITHTGVQTNLRNKGGTYYRGTPTVVARRLLMKSDVGRDRKATVEDFLHPDQANEVFAKRNLESHKELMATYCSIAQKTKFTDRNMQNLLLMTGNMKILWTDPHDLFLGTGMKNMPGENFAGKNLERIRADIMAARKNENFPVIRTSDITRFITGDKFMETWLQMRLTDMCTTVWRLKHYLWTTDKQDEEIDDRFTTHVLDLIYQPCSYLTAFSQEIIIPVPDDFTRMVMSCKGMNIKFSKNFKQEIDELDNERQKLDNDFWNIKERDKDTGEKAPNLAQILVDQNKEITELEKSGASPEEINKLKERQEREFKLLTKSQPKKKKESFEQRQRKRWKKGMEEINKPELPLEEIEETLSKLRAKQLKRLKKKRFASESDRKSFEDKQKKEFAENRSRLMRPGRSMAERNKMIEDLRKELDEKYKKYYNINTSLRTNEEVSRHTEELRRFNERKRDLVARYKKEIEHHKIVINSISQIYWDRIVVMIYFLMQHIRDANTQDIRRAIAAVEMLNSKKVSCENLSHNLDNEEDNCISSALGNLLVGIEAFKYQYGEHIPMGKHDINLAASIILNREINENKVEDMAPEFQEPEEEESQLEFEDDLAAMEEMSSIGEFEGYEDVSSAADSANFGMKYIEEVERVKILLREISQKDVVDIDDLARYFLGMIRLVKTTKMSPQVKTNRINFFATIR